MAAVSEGLEPSGRVIIEVVEQRWRCDCAGVASSKKGLRGRRETMGNEATIAELGE